MTDVIIIGTGPAGISAALTLQANRIPFFWFGKRDLSAKIRKAERIHNYPGLSDVTGEAFAEALRRQIEDAALSIEEKTVTGVYATEGEFSVLCKEEVFQSKSVILATGVETIRTVAGEAEFLGKGVSYCATCDGMFYRGKDIGVLCSAKEFEPEVAFLASLARCVYFFPLYREVSVAAENLVRIEGMPTRLLGSKRLEEIEIGERRLRVEGMFFLKDSLSPALLLPGLKAEGRHVSVDRAMRTSVPGCFACGDCTGRPYQYAKAVGEGNLAAHSAIEYLRAKS